MAKYSTTLATLIQRLADSFDDCVLGVPDSVSTTLTIVDTKRIETDDYFNNWEVRFYAGTHIGNTATVTDFAATTDTITFTPAFSATVLPNSIIDATDYYQLHKKFKWNQYRSAINRAIDTAKYEYLINKKDDTAVQNRLTNWDFETDDTGWTVTGAGATATESATRAAHGAQSYKITVAAADCYGYQAISNPANFRGKSVTLRCWVYAAAASQTYIAVYDGVNTNKSSYHAGDSTWELLEVTCDIDDEATALQVRLGMLAGAGDAYFDMPVFKDAGYSELTIPSGFQRIAEIWYESSPESTNFDTQISNRDWWIVKDGTTPVIRFNWTYGIATGFRIIGQSVQSELTTDTSVCYMPPEFIVQQARAYMIATRSDYKDLLDPAIKLATQERRIMCVPPLPGSRSLYEV